jgi:superfamily II DNA or RNA helicase
MNYQEFIRSKIRRPKSFGFKSSNFNSNLFDWQVSIVDWALQRGRAAIFAECGLGKTLMQLEWASHIVRKTNKSVLLHCPVGVREQTTREASKFGIDAPVIVCDDNSDVKPASICVVNYEKMHKFDLSDFGGVVLDESSVLKNFTGKTKRQLCDAWANCDYRLACTATPAPNDYMELGNHADFLGVMPSNEMLSRWFVNDTMKAGGYRLKGHAQRDFWQWMASWSVCVAKPSDIGGSDDGFELPELIETVHLVDDENDEPPPGFLFNNFALSATNVHKQKRVTTESRARKVAELITDEPWLVWCDTNYEADALRDAIPSAVEIRGSDSDSTKSKLLAGFSNGDFPHLITKPSVAGFGLNWQHCNQMAFIGLSYSFEAYYQAVRRCWRFGQRMPVFVHIVESDGESALRKAILNKQSQFKQMQRGMVDAMQGLQITAELMRDTYHPTKRMELPQWK